MSSSPKTPRSDASDDAFANVRAPLPTFGSLKPSSDNELSKPESSHSGSLRSLSNGKSIDRNESPSLKESLRSLQDDRQDGTQPKRHNSRNSGGFLLDSVSRSSRIPRRLISRNQNDAKGKRVSDGLQLSVAKRRQTNNQDQLPSSLRSSPLANEVTRLHGVKQNGTKEKERDIDSHDLDTPSRTDSVSTCGQNGTTFSSIKVGYDTDPAQIVNMALSLSEGRRRQASAKRYFSADQQGKRIISTASSMRPGNPPQFGTIRRTLPPQRQISQENTPIAKQSVIDPKPNQDFKVSQESPEEAALQDEQYAMMDLDISPGTAIRVQKAKQRFELAYEYRRLLSHLPPIRQPGSHARYPDSSRIYNPLQYVRNRKLRIWEKTAINAESEGWHDVDKVRSWVDAVITSHPKTEHDPNESIRLPALYQQSNEEDGSDHDGFKSQINPPNQRNSDQEIVKPRRPRSDWVTHPGDMLADAFWLEQGMNKAKIQDRDNNLIYPPETNFKFSDWRNRSPVITNSREQVHEYPADQRPERASHQKNSVEELQSPLPQLPTFKSTHPHGSSRSRKVDRIKDSISSKEDDIRLRKPFKLFKDDDSSSTTDLTSNSEDDSKHRGRKRSLRKKHKMVADSERTKVRGQKFTSPPEETKNTTSYSDRSQPSSAPNSKRSSIDHNRLFQLISKDNNLINNTLSRSRNRGETARQENVKPGRPSIEEENIRSSGEFDITAPNSPAVEFPSITINLSPPASRQISPVRKSRASIIDTFRDRSQSKQSSNRVEATDFASLNVNNHESLITHDENGTGKSSPSSRAVSPHMRDISPMTKSQNHSARTDLSSPPDVHRGSTHSNTSTKSQAVSHGDHSRIRGMFKGGRIAELVGNEVSRVGDFIWKRDPPTGHKHRGSLSDGSFQSDVDTDTDEDPIGASVFKTPPPRDPRSRSSTLSSTKSERLSPTSSRITPGSGDRPRYNNPNLPSFTSPFQRDREQQDKKQDMLDPYKSPGLRQNGDHISAMVAAHRSASRSPRLDQLAPPKLTINRPSTPLGTNSESPFGIGLDLTRPRDASDRFNSAIKEPAADYFQSIRKTRSATNLTQDFNTSTVEQAPSPLNPFEAMQRDLTRGEALLLSTAVKAREIGRRAESNEFPQPRFLYAALTLNASESTEEVSTIRRREVHITAAHKIVTSLELSTSQLKQKLEIFNTSVVPKLHAELQNLEDKIENKITPRVQKTADDAGELSMKLTTTSTMAIKALNDSIESAIRRRRRGPIRWVRRFWYASIERAVVGLLWAIWAIVTLVRVILALIAGSARLTRWLLWID